MRKVANIVKMTKYMFYVKPSNAKLQMESIGNVLKLRHPTLARIIRKRNDDHERRLGTLFFC